jgi:uncharacterized protein (TIGR04255 family)
VDKRHYPRPPIIEAVIEVRFEGLFTPREMERVRDRFKRDFPSIEETRNIRVEVLVKGVAGTATPAGFRMTAKNAVDVILINESAIATVRKGPYDKWEELRKISESNFDTFTKVIGRRRVIRLGVRFVNRIDIPNPRIYGRDLSEFIKIGVALPEGIAQGIGQYSLALNFIENTTGARVFIQSAVVDAALIDYTSISLDIDASWDSDIPQRIDEMWKFTERLRDAKNAVFESCITEKLRELFQ